MKANVGKRTRGDEGVLGEAFMLEVLVERSEVLDLTGTEIVIGDRVENDERIMLTHVIIGISLLVREVITLSSC